MYSVVGCPEIPGNSLSCSPGSERGNTSFRSSPSPGCAQSHLHHQRDRESSHATAQDQTRGVGSHDKPAAQPTFVSGFSSV